MVNSLYDGLYSLFPLITVPGRSFSNFIPSLYFHRLSIESKMLILNLIYGLFLF